MAQAVTKWSIGTLRTFSHTIDVWRGKPVVPRLVLAERFGKLYHIWISCGSWTVTLSLELTTCLGSSAVDQLIHCPQLGLLAILYMRLHDEKTKVSKKNQSFPESRSCDLEIWRWNHLRNHVNERKKNSHISIWETQLGDVPNAGNKLNSGNIWLMSLGFKKRNTLPAFLISFSKPPATCGSLKQSGCGNRSSHSFWRLEELPKWQWPARCMAQNDSKGGNFDLLPSPCETHLGWGWTLDFAAVNHLEIEISPSNPIPLILNTRNRSWIGGFTYFFTGWSILGGWD